jgi:L-amino acid N-acyltransferase YncA
MEMRIRRATGEDLPEIVEILNHGVKTRHSVGYYTAQSVPGMLDWFSVHTEERYPVFLAEDQDKVTGWISMSPYRRGREAFDRTGEISAYIHEEHQRTGLGQKLLDHMLDFARTSGYKTIFAVVLDRNIPSVRLLEKNNFEKWAFLPEVAEIDGILHGHLYYGVRL